MRMRFTFIAVVAATAAALAPISGARSESGRTIRIIVPYPPAGGADVVARVVANAIGNKLHGPTMVVENRAGAGTLIGTEDVVRAQPDGDTLLFTNNSLLLLPNLHKVDYDPFSSLEPICNVATTPTVVLVNSASPYRTLGDLVAAARAKPGGLTFGASPGALSHVSYEMLLHRAGIRMTLVPFNGTPPQINALLGQQIDTAFVDYPSAEGLVKTGKLRILASASPARIDWMPDVPTLIESGYKDFEIELWYGAFAPAHTPQQAIARLTDWITKAVQVPAVRSRLVGEGINPVAGACGAPFVSYLHKQYKEFGRAIREANIKVE